MKVLGPIVYNYCPLLRAVEVTICPHSNDEGFNSDEAARQRALFHLEVTLLEHNYTYEWVIMGLIQYYNISNHVMN